jgi:hypothetical protein
VKIHPVGAEFFHADRQPDGQNMTKLIVAFHNFADMPKNEVSDFGFLCMCSCYKEACRLALIE